MAGKRGEGTRPSGDSGIAAELAAAGFEDALEVGRGGAGIVYRCYQTSLGRSVAIKVLASDLDEADQERFLREGYAMGGLSGHPNIENILHVGVTTSSRPYIVMPYHAAGSLAERLHRVGRIGWPDALRIGVKLCGALETAHRAAEMYDIADAKWITLPPLPTPRHAEAVVAVGSALYCIGGADRPTHEGPVPTVEALDFS